MKKFLLIFLVGACASIPDVIIPDLPQRTLLVDPDAVGLKYPYKICTKKFLGKCTKYEMHIDRYDFNDAQLRRKLIDMNFTCTVEPRTPTP